MNKTAIKNYAIWARNELIKQVTQKAYEYEVTKDSVPSINTVSVNGRLLSNEEKNQLNDLIVQVNKYGFIHVVEEIAYTWFNRFIALRYMEVNNYLPQKVRIFTNENNEFKPEILTEAIHLDLENLDKQKVFNYIQNNNQEDLYKYLLLTICNDMNKYLPDMFTSIKDYKALLLPDNLLKENSVLDKLIKDIDEDSFKDQVQIIGWMYQYYNSELKDIVMKKKEYSKDDIPAATQLFTPDWIVRYMVENSLGRLWVDGHPNFNHDNWKYYLEEAEQDPEVIEQLNKIKEEHAKLKPEDIKVLEPCMGSGHILVYAFDVLMDIYRDSGYSDRDAAQSILENNLYGLELDERAYHLAYFALMMKARSFNRRILSKETKVNILEIRESLPLKKEHKQYLGKYIDLANYLVDSFKDAKELGSIINLYCTLEQLDELNTYLNELKDKSVSLGLFEQAEIIELNDVLKPLIKQAILLVQKYDVVITNPPYLTNKNMNKALQGFVNKYYESCKRDLYSCFIKKCSNLTKENEYYALITMHTWMFLSAFKNLRNYILENNEIISMLHLGAGVFKEIAAFNVLATAFIMKNEKVEDYKGTYIRLVDYSNEEEKIMEFANKNNYYQCSQSQIRKIQDNVFLYYLSEKMLYALNNYKNIGSLFRIKPGLTTSNNAQFVRNWYEISLNDIGFNFKDRNEAMLSHKKWFPYNNGGNYRKWYGNNEAVVNWKNDGEDIKNYKLAIREKKPGFNVGIAALNDIFKKGLTYSIFGFRNFGIRYKDYGFLFDVSGASIFPDDENIYYVLGYLASKVSFAFLSAIAPTVNYQAGDIAIIPYVYNDKYAEEINNIVIENIKISKDDWDSFETSWDFNKHPLVSEASFNMQQIKKEQNNGFQVCNNLEDAYNHWEYKTNERFKKIKENEENLNQIFIDIYDLKDELTKDVDNEEITIRLANKERDIKSLISYAVGCMFGRYSLDVQGLAYAGGEFDNSKYKTYLPDTDNIIPICDEEYFDDDIVSRFVEFIKVTYGKESLEENLQFIANALGGNGNSREVLRNYFLNDFFKDHCNTYSSNR